VGSVEIQYNPAHSFLTHRCIETQSHGLSVVVVVSSSLPFDGDDAGSLGCSAYHSATGQLQSIESINQFAPTQLRRSQCTLSIQSVDLNIPNKINNINTTEEYETKRNEREAGSEAR